MKRGKEFTRRSMLGIMVCLAAFASVSPAEPGVVTIDTEQLHTMVMDNAYRLEAGREMPFVIVDARPRAEYDVRHVLSAISVPEHDFDNTAGSLPTKKNTRLVVYGDSEDRETEKKWVARARAAGYNDVLLYGEGFSAWKNAAMPVAPL